jgi:hypothetical protein
VGLVLETRITFDNRGKILMTVRSQFKQDKAGTSELVNGMSAMLGCFAEVMAVAD